MICTGHGTGKLDGRHSGLLAGRATTVPPGLLADGKRNLELNVAADLPKDVHEGRGVKGAVRDGAVIQRVSPPRGVQIVKTASPGRVHSVPLAGPSVRQTGVRDRGGDGQCAVPVKKATIPWAAYDGVGVYEEEAPSITKTQEEKRG